MNETGACDKLFIYIFHYELHFFKMGESKIKNNRASKRKMILRSII